MAAISPISSPRTQDFFHNVTDGVFIGTAFILCSKDIAYTILATTIYHEIAQELADYVLLTHHCGFPIWLALIANATCGLSVIIGVVIIFAANLSNEGIGIILAIRYATCKEPCPLVWNHNLTALLLRTCYTAPVSTCTLPRWSAYPRCKPPTRDASRVSYFLPASRLAPCRLVWFCSTMGIAMERRHIRNSLLSEGRAYKDRSAFPATGVH